MISRLLVLGMFFLIGCSSVKKTISNESKSVDSVQTSVKDTASKKVVVTDQKDFDLTDFNMEIVYDNKDTTKATEIFNKPQIQALHDVVKSVSGNRSPQKVTIHIGKISDSGKVVTKVDITSSHSADSASVKKADVISIRNIEKIHAPVWLTIASIILLLLLIVFIIYKVKQKLTI